MDVYDVFLEEMRNIYSGVGEDFVPFLVDQSFYNDRLDYWDITCRCQTRLENLFANRKSDASFEFEYYLNGEIAKCMSRCAKVLKDVDKVTIPEKNFDHSIVNNITQQFGLLQEIEDEFSFAYASYLLRQKINNVTVCDVFNFEKNDGKKVILDACRNMKLIETLKEQVVVLITADCAQHGVKVNRPKVRDINLLILAFKYFVKAEALTKYVNLVLMIIASSQYADMGQKKVASAIFEELSPIIGKLWIENFRMCKVSTKYSPGNNRGINTSIIQAIVSFDNFDVYGIRVDMPHDNIIYPHLNFMSPGGMEYNFFSDAERDLLVKELVLCDSNVSWEKFFVDYGNLFTISDSLSKDSYKKKVIDGIDKKKHGYSHKCFGKGFDVNDANSFVELAQYFFPKEYVQSLDKEGIYLNNCFRLHELFKIVCGAMMLTFSFDSRTKSINHLLDIAMKKAINLGLCDIEKDEINKIESISVAIDELNESNSADNVRKSII